MKTRRRAGQRHKRIEEVVSYAWGHRIRVYALTVLNEGVYSPEQIANIIGEPTNLVAYHVKELLEAGSIELVETRKARNADQHFYRAIEMPYYSDEEFAALTPQERQLTLGLTLQCMGAEAMAAFWAEKMHPDPQVRLAWRWFNVDARGREEITEELAASWKRIRAIEADSINRCVKTGEKDKSIIVGQLGFERERTSPQPPPFIAEPE